MAVPKSETIKPTKMFEVFGPFVIKTLEGKRARSIEKDQSEFWNQSKANTLRRRIGCYVFAIRAAHGIRPIYVGKTTRSFEKEIFGTHQLYYYNQELADIAKGTPVMFLISYPIGKGKINGKMISDVEEFLIQVAVTKNSNLKNIQGKKDKKWGIQGVIRSGKGKIAENSKKFKLAMGIHSK